MDRRVSSLANAFYHKLGLGKGDRLALYLPNCLQYPELYFSCARSGIIGVPLNTRLAVPELVKYLNYTKPKGAVVHATLVPGFEEIREQVPSVQAIVGLGEGHPYPEDYESLAASSPSEPPEVQLAPDDVYLLGPTSGTTGIPKGAILTHRNAYSAMMLWYGEIAYPQFGSYIQAIPQFFNPGGPANMIAFLKGGSTIVLPEFSPQSWLETVQRQRPFFAILVPTMLQMVLNHPDIRKYDLSSVGGITTGGSPIPVNVLRQGQELFGNIFFPFYGMAETYSSGAVLRRADLVTEGPEEKLRRLMSAGHPMLGMEMRVVNENFEDVKCNGDDPGEIIVRGPNVSPAYWEMPEETAQARRDGWFLTGDVAVVDQEGYIFIVDRKKDMIITGGINVFSIEVEQALHSHAAVQQAAVIGVPDEQWGEAMKALVILRPGTSATEEELIEHCRKLLASYKKPRSVELVDSLPISATGKVLKRVLREPYWRGQERRVH